jgi:hypothetical protein
MGYNVAAVLYGHTHGRKVYRWDGTNKAAKDGIPTFNVDNSSHFGGKQQAFFYFELRADEVIVREYQTSDAWDWLVDPAVVDRIATCGQKRTTRRKT